MIAGYSFIRLSESHAMRKLYYPRLKPTDFWERWDNEDGSATLHWGKLGTEGERTTVRGSLFKSVKSKIEKEENRVLKAGFEEISFEEHKVLLIEYAVDGWGTEEDIKKRHRLEDQMNETLGWTGLGNCDGGSTGSGSMEVCCFVVDFELASSIIAEDLKNTEFSDFTRIYEE